MRFTSHEIKQQKFKKKMRGLDPEEVEVFVQMVADDFAEFEKENKTLKNRLVERPEKPCRAWILFNFVFLLCFARSPPPIERGIYSIVNF